MTTIFPARGLLGVTLVGALTVALSACSAGGQPTPAVTAGAPASAADFTSAAGSTSAGDPTSPATMAGATETGGSQATTGIVPTPGPTEVPGPPVASVVGGAAGIVQGELGTFTWDGLGSDAPWIVPSGAVPVAAGARLAVTLDPSLVPRRWTARWAPVLAGSAGDPAAVLAGTDAPIEVATPVSPGTWGLQVEITFAEGRRAAWYWRVTVAP